ncbi:MAG: SPOR domain-containing protein [Bacteroidales bacterium]|nr:SPOR domain-containing protein [Bacteroidales bacterium]
MDKHIAALLKTNNRVIIPGFGALIAREGGEKLTFNELLKFDDGLLNDYVSKAEGTDKKITEANIKKYVDKVSAGLKKGESVKLSTIGALVIDDKGKIQFEQSGSPKDVKTPPVKKEETEPAKPVSPPPPPPPVSSAPIEESKPKETIKPAAEEPKKQEPKKEEPKKEVPKEESPAQPKPTAVPESDYKKTAAVNKPEVERTAGRRTPPPKNKPPKATRSGDDNKKKGWLVWVIILVILIGGGTTSWFLFTDQIKGFIQAHISKSHKQPELPIIDTTTYVVDTIVELPDEEVIEDKDIVPLDPYAKTGQYYVVAGCFRFERNADRYVNQLNKKGYNARKFGKRKGNFVVCFETYATKNEALRKMREIRNTIEPEAWVLKY